MHRSILKSSHACISVKPKKHGLSLNKSVSEYVTVINMHLNATWSTKTVIL